MTGTYRAERNLARLTKRRWVRFLGDGRFGVTRWLPGDFVRGVAVLFAGRIGFIALSLVAGILLARGLGPEGRGAYVAVLLWPGLLGWLATLGFTKATTFFRSRDPGSEQDLVTTGLWVSALAGTLFMLVAQLFLPRFLQGYPDWVVDLGRLSLLFVPLLALSDIVMGVFDGARQFRLVTAFRILTPSLQVGGLIVLYLTGRLTVSSAVWLNCVGIVVTMGLQYLVVSRRSGVSMRLRKAHIIETGRYALRFFPALVADLALSSLDQILLVPLLTPVEMGLYVIATRASIIVDVPVAISQLVFASVPGMAPAQGLRLAQRATLIGLFITGIAALSLMVVAEPLILLMYGEAFNAAATPFRVLLVGAFAVGVRRILADGLSGIGKPQYSSAGQLIGLATMAMLLWVLVPMGGMLFAVWAVATAQWVNLTVTGILFWTERRRVLAAATPGPSR